MSFKFRTVSAQNVFRTARINGSALSDVVDAVRKCSLPWTGENDKAVSKIEEIRDAYKSGLVAGRLRLSGEGETDEAKLAAIYELAAAIIAKRPFKADADDTDNRRTFDEHAAVRSADSMWSQLCRMAGRPATKKGKNSTTKVTTPAANAEDGAPRGNGVLMTVPTVANENEAFSFALRVRDLIEGFIARNAKVKMDDVGTLFRTYLDGAHKLSETHKE